MKFGLYFFLCCICGAAAVDSASAQPAAMFRGDPSLTGNYPAAPPRWIDAVGFSIQTGGPIRSAPTIDHGVLYFGSADGNLYAENAQTGKEIWRFVSGGAIASTPAVANGRVFFASRDGTLYGLEAATGTVVWKLRFGPDLGLQNYWDYYLSSPTLADGTLFIGSGDGHLYALDPVDGRERWVYDAGSRVRTTAAVARGVVVFGTMSGYVKALRQHDGSQLWSFATQGAAHTFADKGNDTTSVVASPTIAGGSVVAGGRDGYLYSLDLKTGRERWRSTHDGSSWMLSTAYDGHTLYIGGGSALIVQAADPATGKEKWRFKTRSAVFGSPAIAGDTLVVSDFSGTLYALDKATGTLEWQFPMGGGHSLATPVVTDEAVYCGSDNGIMYALSAATKTTRHAGSPRRIVYFQGAADPDAPGWFANGVDTAMLGQFIAAGYEQMDAVKLLAFMQAAPTVPSVVVFVDNKLPASLSASPAGLSVLRTYLENAGKIVFLGPNPLADPDVVKGGSKTTDQLFGMSFGERSLTGGFYASTPTPEGRKLGLRSVAISFTAIDPQPTNGVTTLALDEFGKAGEWLKNFGGPAGTGMLQLAVPRQELFDLTEMRAAIEAGVTW